MFRTGIIGYGKMGKLRAKLLEQSKQFELIAISDTQAVDCNCNRYSNYTYMLKEESLDCVFVGVPHTLTTGITVNCLHSGLHVFAEKPPGLSLFDIELMENAKQKENILQFGFNHRYYQHAQFLHDIVKSKKYGKLLWLRGQYGRTKNEGWRLQKELGGRGIFISQGLHMLDMVLWLTGHYNGSDVVKLKSAIVSYYKNEGWFEDNVFILLESQQGIAIDIHSSCTLSQNTFNLWAQFEDGWVELSGVNTSTKSFDYPERIIHGATNDELYYGNPPKTSIQFEHDTSWETEINNFTGNVHNQPKRYDCSLEEAKSLMRLLDEIYERGV